MYNITNKRLAAYNNKLNKAFYIINFVKHVLKSTAHVSVKYVGIKSLATDFTNCKKS